MCTASGLAYLRMAVGKVVWRALGKAEVATEAVKAGWSAAVVAEMVMDSTASEAMVVEALEAAVAVAWAPAALGGNQAVDLEVHAAAWEVVGHSRTSSRGRYSARLGWRRQRSHSSASWAQHPRQRWSTQTSSAVRRIP